MILSLMSENKSKIMSKKEYTATEIGKLADSFGKSLLTIQRWIAKGDDRLTSEKAIKALQKK